MSDDLHARLIARQTDEELERKARKACMHRGKLWTQEELDAADREADRMAALFAERLEALCGDSVTERLPEGEKTL